MGWVVGTPQPAGVPAGTGRARTPALRVAGTARPTRPVLTFAGAADYPATPTNPTRCDGGPAKRVGQAARSARVG